MANMRLSTKFVLSIGLALTLILSGELFWINYEQNELHMQSARTAGIVASELVMEDLNQIMATGSNDQLPDVLNRMNTIEDIKEVRVIRSDFFEKAGDYIAKDNYDEETIHTGKPKEIFDKKDKTYRKIVPFIVNESCVDCHEAQIGDVLGAASITVTQNAVAAHIEANSMKKFYFTILVIFIITGALYGIITFLVLRPLHSLTDGAKKVSKGDTDVSVNIKSHDELGLLGQAFNKMVYNLNRNTTALHEERIKVEQKAEEVQLAVMETQEQKEYLEKSVDAILVKMEQFADGDLTVQIEGQNEDAIGKLYNGFNRAVLNIQGMIQGVSSTVKNIFTFNSELSSLIEKVADGAEEQKSQSIEVAGAMEEMTQTIASNAQHSSDAVVTAQKSGKDAKAGGEIIHTTINGMVNISQVVEKSAENIKSLGKSSNEIGNIIQVIHGIADQTNLLALNAAIEAARAGEQGRGFAVVADEVRKLAEETTSATKEISAMIQEIQTGSNTAVSSMTEVTREVESGKKMADQAGASLNSIIENSDELIEMITQVATASEEQSSTSMEISRNIEQMSQISEGNTSLSNAMAHSQEKLTNMLNNLQQNIRQFKFSNSGIASGRKVQAQKSVETFAEDHSEVTVVS
ncbi:MAG: HAMP domain-containing protein [Deferribacteres bacterium]|nr:HAMP domain-containing protein [candidate division KSB1 bacterium]MCB9503672.1 HAMP domain-containing protein [Deferribacteres bacterium]